MELDYAEITDHVLKVMKVDKIMEWDNWWIEFVNEDIPNDETIEYAGYKAKRLYIKDRINDELTARKLSTRLICEWSNGVKMVNGSFLARHTTITNIKKISNSLVRTQERLETLAKSDDNGLNDSDKKMLVNLAAHTEGNLSHFAGTVGRMRSLPPDFKRQLLLEMGIEV